MEQCEDVESSPLIVVTAWLLNTCVQRQAICSHRRVQVIRYNQAISAEGRTGLVDINIYVYSTDHEEGAPAERKSIPGEAYRIER